MTSLLQTFAEATRLLVEAELRPVQGHRFQPTGFPDLGAAAYQLPDGTPMLLVESVQSVANRLETAIWDETNDDLVQPLRGMPYVRVLLDGGATTNSILEAHRLNSPYILEGADTTVLDQLAQQMDTAQAGPLDMAKLAKLIVRIDPNAILHGVFLAKKELSGGRLRMKRALSGFVEARNVRVAESGGVKNDRVDPSGDTSRGFGNVPYHRTEYVAEDVRAYFNLDLALLRSYQLPEEAQEFLLSLAMFKIRRFLGGGLRLRTACDLDLTGELTVTRPEGARIPSEAELAAQVADLVSRCAKSGVFADPPVTELRWKAAKAGRARKAAATVEEDEG